jgi:hypothetical protein
MGLPAASPPTVTPSHINSPLRAVAAASGVQQETAGSESVTFGFDSYKAISDLTAGEKAVLDRLFPKRANVVVLRP